VKVLALALVALLLLSCSSEDPGATSDVSVPDATVPDAPVADGGPNAPPAFSPGARFAVGTGEPTIFVPPVAGEVIRLQRGCQGAQHIFTSLRILDATETFARVGVAVHRVDDGALVSVPLDVRLPLETDPFSDRVRRVTGLTPVVESPADVVGQRVEVRATYTTDSGEVFQAAFSGVVQWGTDSCGSH
jgi:hypothetical protein